MRTIEVIRSAANEGNQPAAYINGLADGQAARANKSPLTAYLRVGIDDYARGFRAGFYDRSVPTSTGEVSAALHVVNL